MRKMTARDWLVVCAVGALYAPIELTRVIILYRSEWPGAAPFGVPALFDAELAFMWLPWVAGAEVETEVEEA